MRDRLFSTSEDRADEIAELTAEWIRFPTVKILDQTFGDYDQQAIRVTARYDAQPLNPKAIVKLTGINI